MNLFKPVRFLKKEEIEDQANEVLMKMQKEGFPPRGLLKLLGWLMLLKSVYVGTKYHQTMRE
jgi:hypothetical protein